MENKITPSIVIRSTLFWSIVGLIAVPYTTLALFFACVRIIGVRTRHRIISSWGQIFVYLIRYLCKVDYTVNGLENLIDTPVIIASNHQSMWETIAFSTIFPRHVWILKHEILKIPFFGWTMATLSPIAINRSRGSEAVQQILGQGVSRVEQGFSILVFPEGTRVRPGEKRRFKFGAAKMAKALNLPIIPVAHNAGYILPKKSFWIYPGVVRIIVDKPLYPDRFDSTDSLLEKLKDVVYQNLAIITH